MGRDEGAAPGTESAFSLILCPHPQEAVPRERPIPWCESWGPPIAHLQVSIPLDEGTGDGKVRSHGSHPTSVSAFCPVFPQLPHHPVLEPGSLLQEVPQPLQGLRTPTPRYQACLCVYVRLHPEVYVCAHRILGPVVYIGDCTHTWFSTRDISPRDHVHLHGPTGIVLLSGLCSDLDQCICSPTGLSGVQSHTFVRTCLSPDICIPKGEMWA